MKKPPILLTKTHIVGVIASQSDFDVVINHPRSADFLEWRVDCLQNEFTESIIRRLNKPIILTVRDSAEGGSRSDWGIEDRRKYYLKYLDLASFIDIEAVNAGSLSDVITEAKKKGIGVIISHHLFKGPWNEEIVKNTAQVCADFGGDIFKVAISPDSYDGFCKFVGYLPELAKRHAFQIAPMAMGEKFGKISRLLFALGGSPLVYTYLSKPQVKGQWGAMEFGKELAKFQ